MEREREREGRRRRRRRRGRRPIDREIEGNTERAMCIK